MANATTSEKQETIDKLRDVVKGIRMAMLTTTHGGRLVSRPMSTQEMSPTGMVWFLTSAESDVAKEINMNPWVNIAYADTGAESYVSISGAAKIKNDRAQIKEFWKEFYKAWFDGPDDPTIRVIEIDSVSAEYWTTKGGKIVSLVSAALSALTGKDMEAGENKKISL